MHSDGIWLRGKIHDILEERIYLKREEKALCQQHSEHTSFKSCPAAVPLKRLVPGRGTHDEEEYHMPIFVPGADVLG